jgi:hypothetical protein
MAAVFMPGPFEVIVILGLIGVMAVFLAVMVAALRFRSPSRNNPNLAPCPDCGRLISIRATTCPHCGGPVQFK